MKTFRKGGKLYIIAENQEEIELTTARRKEIVLKSMTNEQLISCLAKAVLSASGYKGIISMNEYAEEILKRMK